MVEKPHWECFFSRATASNAIICEDFDEIIGVEGGLEEPFP
jgi:hypothetical protein